jgi:hypothetical protein
LRAAGDGGRTRNQVRDYFGRNRSADEIGAALTRLEGAKKVRRSLRAAIGPGRPSEVWTVEAR